MQADYNLQSISTKELSSHLKCTFDLGGNILLIARRGTGKTMITSDTITGSQYKEVYMNMALYERPDLAGYPSLFSVQENDRFVKFLLPYIYKDLIDGSQPCIVHLDEVDKTDFSILAPLLELVNKRSINGTPLRNIRAVVMTGNLPEEGGKKPHEALLDRTEKYLVQPNYKDWLEWGGNSGALHPSVTAFITEHPEYFVGDVNMSPDSFADESGRAWHYVSKMVCFGEQADWDPSLITQKAIGCVGSNAGIQYAKYYLYITNLQPMVEKILQGTEVPEFKQLNTSQQLTVCMMSCRRLAKMLNGNSTNTSDTATALAKFLTTTDTDISLMAIRSQLGIKRFTNSLFLKNTDWMNLLTLYSAK